MERAEEEEDGFEKVKQEVVMSGLRVAWSRVRKVRKRWDDAKISPLRLGPVPHPHFGRSSVRSS